MKPVKFMSFTSDKQILIFLLFAVIFLLPGNLLFAQTERPVRLGVQQVRGGPVAKGDSGDITVVFKFLSGQRQGDTAARRIHLWGHPHYDADYTPGYRFVGIAKYNKNGKFSGLSSIRRQRDYPLLILFLLVSLAIFAIGRFEGLVGFGATLLTVFLLFGFLFPIAAAGSYLLPTGILICLTTIFITVFLVMRQARATIPALITLTILFFLLLLMSSLGMTYLQLDGVFARNSRLILSYLQLPHDTARGVVNQLIILGIVVSCLGAIMDVAVVISSTIDEIVRDRLDMSFKETFWHGMHVGGEILSTMVNTLVFAYMGVLFPILLSLQIFELNWIRFLNYHFVGIEILRICTGLVGLALTIPTTALFSTWWCRR